MDRRQAAIDEGRPEWNDLPASEREAKALLAAGWPDGLPKRVFTGRPCKWGHVSPRWASGYACCACDSERDATPEAKEKERAYGRKPEVAERRREYERTRGARADVREANRHYLRERYARPEVKQSHRAYMRGNTAKREACKLRATPPWLTADHHAQIKAFYDEAIRLTEATGILHEVDHIVPLRNPRVCGLHVPWNLRVITKDENRFKSNRFDGGW